MKEANKNPKDQPSPPKPPSQPDDTEEGAPRPLDDTGGVPEDPGKNPPPPPPNP